MKKCFIWRIDSNKEKKEENNGIEVCTIYLCWGDILKRLKRITWIARNCDRLLAERVVELEG